MPYSVGLTQAYKLRQFAFETADELSKTKASTLEESVARAQGLSQSIKSWQIATDRVRIMRGRPLPGSLRPKAKAAAGRVRRTATLGDCIIDDADPTPGTDQPNGTEPTI